MNKSLLNVSKVNLVFYCLEEGNSLLFVLSLAVEGGGVDDFFDVALSVRDV